MKKAKIILPLLTLFLASCGGNSSATGLSTAPGHLSMPTTTSEKALISEIPDVAAIESGDYIRGKEIYRLDKANKKLKILNFGMDYRKYKNNEGTTVAEVDIQFVRFSEIEFDCIYYTLEDASYLIYQSLNTINCAKITDAGLMSSTIYHFPKTLIEPTYGNYVSEAKTKNKVGPDGQRIPNSEGGYETETFYLFLELTETSAKVYVGANNTEHSPTPLHQIENYVLSYNNGGVAIRIPHESNPDYNVRLTFRVANEIRFTNDSEVRDDYGCSGNFTLMGNAQ